MRLKGDMKMILVAPEYLQFLTARVFLALEFLINIYNI